jgi:hypothetical protein
VITRRSSEYMKAKKGDTVEVVIEFPEVILKK